MYIYDRYDEYGKIKCIVKSQNNIDSYILDAKNAIVVKNHTYGYSNSTYTMIHQRIKDNLLIEVNRWTINNYYTGYIRDNSVLKEHNLFKIQNGFGGYDGLYDYKEGSFIIKPGTWKYLEFGLNNENVENFAGIVAGFDITSSLEPNDEYSYFNEITGEQVIRSFKVNDGSYFAILNLDGSIRGNKLFKGTSLSKVDQVIDLNNYQSLDNFIYERIEICDDIKCREKNQFYSTLVETSDGVVLPYQDLEVARILNLNK